MKNNSPILLLEDDAIDIKSIQRSIKKLEIENEVVALNNGQEGLNYLKENLKTPPCLILLDLKMPLMGGLEYLDHFNQLTDQFSKAPSVIVLTSSDNQNDVAECFDKQVGGYLVKPLETEKLKEVLDNIKME